MGDVQVANTAQNTVYKSTGTTLGSHYAKTPSIGKIFL